MDSAAWKTLAYQMLKAAARLNDLIAARQSGEVVETPASPGPLKTSTSTEGLSELFAYWQSQAPRRPNTIREFKTAVQRFEALHPKIFARQIERRHVIEFRDKLLAHASPRTAKKTLSLLGAILQCAVDGEKLPANPVRGVKVMIPKGAKKTRVGFTDGDLAAIFSSPVYANGDRPKAGAGEAAYWLPLLGLYTGARLGELGQLRVSDFRELQGIWFLSISDEEEGATLKTDSSRRRVPIHPHLVGLGFLTYVQERREAGEAAPLFPELTPDSRGVLTGSWSKWFGRWLRNTVLIMDRRKVFHSFRHTFKDACREAGITQEVHDQLSGHAARNVGSTYGGDTFPLKPLSEAVGKINFNLPNIVGFLSS
jgi:integrase